MGLFWQNNETNQEEDGEIKKMSVELKQKLGDLECEEAILKDKERFGRVRKSVMDVLRAKHSNHTADRALSRINKRSQKNYFNGKTLNEPYKAF